MSQSNIVDKSSILDSLNSINRIEGFDPTLFAVEYTDMASGKSWKKIPVLIQIAWFRMVYPEGRIATTTTPCKDGFIATARIYPNYKDGPECYLADATASRGYDQSKPSISPREWAQTAAIGIALRNAGFGVQFGIAADDYEGPVLNELTDPLPQNETDSAPVSDEAANHETVAAERELTEEEKLQLALRQRCPISKYSDKTLGDLQTIDPKALSWIANKFTGNPEISDAAKRICEHALQETSA